MVSKTNKPKGNKMFDLILEHYEAILYFIANITVRTLEFIGISTVIFGAGRVLFRYAKRIKNKDADPPNAVIELGRSLALALEFKMGAEIVNTVIIRELKELLILGIVILLRAILAVLIHWEITTEEKEERALNSAKKRALKREQKRKEDSDDDNEN